MLKNILITIAVAAALSVGTMGTARAMLSEPDVVYHGTALNAAAGNYVTITLNGSTSPLASCTLGADRKYLLRVPMDAFDPRTPAAARQGDAAAISVDGVVPEHGNVVIPGRGTLVKLDLGARTAEQWAEDHPGDNGSGDMNKNGVTDLAEYLAGNDPASCVWATVDAVHAETDVYHPQVLKNCLMDAGGDGKHNLIRVTRGTYSGNFSYKSEGVEAVAAYDLTLTGGHDPDGIAERAADPALTVLDGGGNGIALAVDTLTNISSGKVHMESLTFRNGKGEKGGGIQARIYQGELELVGNIVSGNSADGGGGLSVESSDSGHIFLANNIIYGNSAANAAAVRIVSASAGPVTLLNNTVADNTATADGDGRSFLIVSSTASVDVTNNIITAASGVNGKDIFIDSAGVAIALSITHNDFDAANGLLVNTPGFVADASNIGDAPLFVAAPAGNYRLAPGSPGIDKGIVHAKLPVTDADGTIRIFGNGVDLGAYEFNAPLSYTVTGNLKGGSGGISCDSPVIAGNSSICWLAPATGWYAWALTDNSNDVLSQASGNQYTIHNVTANHTVEVTFQNQVDLVQRLSGIAPHYYQHIQDAFDEAVNIDKIMLLDMSFTGDISFNRTASILLQGGFVSGFTSNPGFTSITGTVTIINGSVVMDKIVIK